MTAILGVPCLVDNSTSVSASFICCSFSLCLCVFIWPSLYKDPSYWDSTLPFPNRSHSEVPGVRTSYPLGSGDNSTHNAHEDKDRSSIQRKTTWLLQTQKPHRSFRNECYSATGRWWVEVKIQASDLLCRFLNWFFLDLFVTAQRNPWFRDGWLIGKHVFRNKLFQFFMFLLFFWNFWGLE